MESTNDVWNRLAKRCGHRVYSVKVNLLDIKDWWVERKRKKLASYAWGYECGCGAVGYLSTPY